MRKPPLSYAEISDLWTRWKRGESLREIARGLGRAPSTISREVRRHGGRAVYRATAADARAWGAARRPKPCRLALHVRLRRVVAEKLAAAWSPQQIAGWLKITSPDTPTMQVSHETIYLTLFVQSRGVLKKALLKQLRRRSSVRRSRQAKTEGQGRGQIVDASDCGRATLLHRHARRASIPLRPARPRGRERHRQCGRGPHARHPAVPAGAQKLSSKF